MKTGWIILLALLINSSLSFAQKQEQQQKQKLTKEEKKELRKQEKEETQKLVAQLVNNRTFVLEADNLMTRYGQTFPVSSSINFISIDSTKAVFQFGSVGMVGINGMGGVTIEGKVSSWDVKIRKRGGSYFVQTNLLSPMGNFDLRFDITSSGMADATITTNTGGRIHYSGRIVSPDQSRTYKGLAL